MKSGSQGNMVDFLKVDKSKELTELTDVKLNINVGYLLFLIADNFFQVEIWPNWDFVST